MKYTKEQQNELKKYLRQSSEYAGPCNNSLYKSQYIEYSENALGCIYKTSTTWQDGVGSVVILDIDFRNGVYKLGKLFSGSNKSLSGCWDNLLDIVSSPYIDEVVDGGIFNKFKEKLNEIHANTRSMVNEYVKQFITNIENNAKNLRVCYNSYNSLDGFLETDDSNIYVTISAIQDSFIVAAIEKSNKGLVFISDLNSQGIEFSIKSQINNPNDIVKLIGLLHGTLLAHSQFTRYADDLEAAILN